MIDVSAPAKRWSSESSQLILAIEWIETEFFVGKIEVYYGYWFEKEEDLIIFKLRWS